MQDDDGDIVKCRWANIMNGRNHSQSNECYSVCEAFPGAILNEASYTFYLLGIFLVIYR